MEHKKITKAMARVHRKFDATNPNCKIKRARLVKKYSALMDRMLVLMGQDSPLHRAMA